MADENSLGPRVKSPLELDKLAIYTEPASAEDRSAKLTWSLIFNHPRITIFTNKKELANKENDWGKITAKIDVMVAYGIIEELRRLVNEPIDSKVVIKNNNFPIIDGARSSTAVHVNDIIIGKDSEGVIWITIKEENKPTIKFNITFSEYHSLYTKDNVQFTAAKASELATLAYCNILERVLAQAYFMPDQLEILNTSPEDKKAKYNTNGKYKPNPSYKGNSSPAAKSGDDFPF